MYIFSFCVAAIVSEEHRFLCVFILACWHWCKPGVITSVSARSCYISVVTRDVMGCECERVCERVKSSLMWALGPRPRESPESTQKKNEKKNKQRAIPSTLGALQRETPSHIPSCSAPRRSSLPWWSHRPIQPLFTWPLLMKSCPILACLCTDVL